MGTDIHGRVQVRYSRNETWFDEGPVEDSRNYRVFAMLAGVRNGYGFAGCLTHEPIVPISEPRGLPDDNVPPREGGDFWWGDHSHSWVTLREVLDWPQWGASLQRYGVVDRAEYERMRRDGGAPLHWCGGVVGPDIVTTTEAEVMTGTAPENWTHVQVGWTERFSDTAPLFRKWLDYMEAKWGWLIEQNPDDVRLVFGFDS